MRAVVQRVLRASVSVDDTPVAAISGGLLCFVGISPQDAAADLEYIRSKVLDLRVFPDAEGRMNRSARETNADVLVISQFTLYADARKGRRPSYSQAAQSELAEPLFERLLREMRASHSGRVETGRFGADMKIESIGDGPVTILLDSSRQF